MSKKPVKAISTRPSDKAHYSPGKELFSFGDLKFESHGFCVRWPLVTFDSDGVYRTPQFELCSAQWVVSLEVVEDELGASFLSCHLANVSDHPVRASYRINLVNQDSDRHFSWEDPEGTIVFSKRTEGNNKWGNYELVSLQELCSLPGILVDDKIFVRIDIYVEDYCSLSDHRDLAQQIEKMNSTEELIRLANNDLHEVISKLPHSRNIKAQKQQEDKIVKTRGNK